MLHERIPRPRLTIILMKKLLQNILSEPAELTQSLDYTTGQGHAELQRAASLVRDAQHIIITGIGSSWHAGMAVQSLFLRAGIFATLHDASELLHYAEIPSGSVLIMLSRSGRSVEIVGLLEKAAASHALVIGVTNTPESPLGQQATVVLPLKAAFDHNISITMYTALVLVGGLLAVETSKALSSQVISSLRVGFDAVEKRLPGWRNQIENSSWICGEDPTYFLARGSSLASCHETRLLWEEGAKAPASALPTGGFRHGPQEFICSGVRIGLWIPQGSLRKNDLALAKDLRSQGVRTLLIGSQLPVDAADLVLDLPPMPQWWEAVFDIIPTQLVAERFSRQREVDCDSFRYCPYIIESEGGL